MWILGSIAIVLLIITFSSACKHKNDVQDRQVQLAALFLIAAILAFK